MGEVYLAEHRLLKRPCAIKLIRPGTRADPRVLARFEREVRTTATLSHPNTIEIYDYGRTDDGTFYYVMEYLRGLSLEDLVARHGPQPPARVIHLLRQACAALTEAHAQGMVHRDLKPANLFASVRGGVFDTVKVLDFGLVKPLAPLSDAPELSTDGRVQGTPQYMPPEQATGQKIDPRADLYALGGVAYHLLTGRAPFEGDNAVLMLIAQARDPVVPPSQRQPGIPADLEAVVLRCLAKSPDERYPDAASVSRALARCAAASGWGNDEAAAWWAAHESLATRLPAPEDDDPITDVDDGSDLNGSTDATAAAAPPLALPALDGDSPR
jgi:serine/threonine-protein kinase